MKKQSRVAILSTIVLLSLFCIVELLPCAKSVELKADFTYREKKQAIRFDASPSTGNIVAYHWHFGDTNPTTTWQVTHDNSGMAENRGPDYTTVHDASVAWMGGPGFSICALGQWWYAFQSYFYLERQFNRFDTSNLPDDCYIVSAKLRLYGQNKKVDTDFIIRIQGWTEADDGISTTDYDAFDGINYDDGNFWGSMWDMYGTNDIVFADYSIVNKEGWTDLCLRTSRDIDSQAPQSNGVDNYEMVGVWYEGTAYPILHVTHYDTHGKKVSHTYASPGNYDVTLIVVDRDGNTDSITKTITF